MTFPVTDASNQTQQLLTGAELQTLLQAITAAAATVGLTDAQLRATPLNVTDNGGSFTVDTGTAGTFAITAALPAGTNTLGAVNLGTIGGAATSAKQDTMITALGSPLQAGGTVDTVVKSTATNRSATVGTTASTLIPANAARRGFSIQNQSTTANLYISGIATATADNQSLLIPPLALYESTPQHTGTGAISAIASAAGVAVYSREF